MFSLKLQRSVGVLSVGLLLAQLGCRTWVGRPLASETAPTSANPGVLRVTMTQGKTMTLREAIVDRDSIVGLFSSVPSYRVAIALSDAAKIEQQIDTTPRWARMAFKTYRGVLLFASVVGAAA